MAPPAVITTVSTAGNSNYTPPQSSIQQQQHMQQRGGIYMGSAMIPAGAGAPGAAVTSAAFVPVTPSASSSPEDDAVVHGQWQHMTRTLFHYERLEQIGEGTYGQVYRAVCKDTGRQVALKKMRLHHGGYWGMPLQLVREIKILKRLRHPNLLQMLEVVTSKGVEYLDQDDEHSQDAANAAANNKDGANKQDRVSDAREAYKGHLFLVLEYISHDLTGLLDVGHVFDDRAVKTIMQQLFRAVAYLHENKYVHRDIKSSNILIDSYHRLKLADFGLARCLEPPILDQMVDRASSLELTNKVITLWYRPPDASWPSCA
jgi:cyclin-dependent kinase 12/13